MMPHVNASWRVVASRFDRSRMAFFWMKVPLASVRRDWSRRGDSTHSPAPVSGLEHELSTLFLMVCKQVTRLRTEKPPTGAVRAGFPTVLAWADRVWPTKTLAGLSISYKAFVHGILRF